MRGAPSRATRCQRTRRCPISPRQADQRRRSSPGAAASPPIRRRDAQLVPRGSPPTTARGSASAAVSTITRTAMNGNSCAAATCGDGRALHVDRRCAGVAKRSGLVRERCDRACALLSSVPHSRRARGDRAAQMRCAPRPSRSTKRAPSAEITSLGSTMVPARQRGIETAGQPEAHECRDPGVDQRAGGRAAAVAPMPLTASSDPSPSRDNNHGCPSAAPHRVPGRAPPPRAPRRPLVRTQ